MFISLHTDQLQLSGLTTTCHRKTIFGCGLRDVLNNENMNKSVGVSSILWSLSGVITVDFPLGPETCIATDC